MLVESWIELRHSNLKDHIGLECLFGRDDLSARLLVCLVGDGGLDASAGLDEECAAVLLCDSLDSVWSDGDSLLIFIHFFWNTNGNLFGVNSKPVLTGGRKLRLNQSTIDHEGFLITNL